jgi:hypothetical protein
MRIPRKVALAVAVIAAHVAAFAASYELKPAAYIEHVKYLASDQLGGRGNGTPELDKAAKYIASHFRKSGLKPAGDGGSYFQKFMLAVGSRLGPGNRLTLTAGGKTVEGVLGKSFVPVGVGSQTGVSGEVVFAGYGIVADEYKYNDYAGIDVTDKVVLALAHEPKENDADSPFAGAEATMHSQENQKAIRARYAGARAILLVQDPANHPEAPSEISDAARANQISELGICVLKISRELAQALLAPAGKDLLALQKEIDANMAPRSFVVTGAQAKIDLDVTRIRKEVSNVVGILPGTDPAAGEELVILGAHYDHLGRGGRSSMSPALIGEIHNGADDNASGTAGLLELASVFGKDAAPRKRSYLFIAFAGEEVGLNGSGWWTNHPTRPIEKAVAMLNMDMIGRPQNNMVLLGGIGTSPVFADITKAAAGEAGMEVRASSQGGYGSSDHASFYSKNMPVLFFFSGLHRDYHRPSDDWQTIDAEGAVRIVRMVQGVASRLNSMETRPQFTKVIEPAGSGARPGAGSGPGYGVYFGSIPDMGAEVKGVRFSDVRPNSPAAKAGLKGQDTLVRFDGKEVLNLEDFTFALRTHKPGDEVDVVVIRDGQPVTVKVKLEARR